MHQTEIREVLKRMPYTLRVGNVPGGDTEYISIQAAIDYADSQTGNWTILVYPGVYDEGDITAGGGASITLKGMGEGRVLITPTAVVTAVIVSAHNMQIEDITVGSPGAGFPAIRVTGGVFVATSCPITGVGAGDAIQQVGGNIELHDCYIPAGDIDLTDAACVIEIYNCNINGTIDTSDGAGAGVVMNVTVNHCDLHDNALNLAATGACIYDFNSNNHIGTITDASLGAGAVNGHLCRCHVTGNGLVKNGTTGWLIDNTELTALSNTNAVGVINMYCGITLAFTNVTGVILWYESPAYLKVLPSGTNDHISIQAAIDALPATGGEVFLFEGTYHIEVALVLDSYQTLRGCGRNTILTTTTANLDIITATGASGTEKVGITIADLCVDGNAGGVANDIGILWTYVDYSKITNCWILDNPEYGIRLSTSDYNELIGNILEGNATGITDSIGLSRSSHNTITGNICQDNNEGIGLTNASNNNTISGNICQGNVDNGILLNASSNNTVSGNTCNGNLGYGIFIYLNSNNNTLAGNTCRANHYGIYSNSCAHNTICSNTCQANGHEGIILTTSNHNLISSNNCFQNSAHGDNSNDNINLITSDYNLIVDNICRAPTIGTTLTVGEPSGETEIAVTDTTDFEVGSGVVIDLGGVNEEYHRISSITAGTPGVITIDAGLTNNQGAGETIDVPEARYGINILDIGANENRVGANDLYDSGKTAAFNDAGTDTKLDSITVPFSHGSDPQDSGYEIDLGGEFARAWARLPAEVQQVVRMKIYARAIILSATTMALEINVNGGADNEPFNQHATAAPNTPSTSTNFAANDIIFWTLTSAQIVALTGGDSVQIVVLHEAADGGGVVTDAFLRTVEFEYV